MPGDSAKIKLNPGAPYRAGLFSVEREGIVSFRPLAPAAPAFELPLTESSSPGVLLYGWFFRSISPELPRGPQGKVVESCSERLDVEFSPARSLRVSVRPSKTDAAPRDTIEVDVDVASHDDKPTPAEVTLYVVDEGVLQLSRYESPDLARYITSPVRHLVETSETRSDVGWVIEPVATRGRLGGSHRSKAPSIRMGATSVGSSEGPRSNFEPTPLYLPSLETDDKGHAHASFKLPDSLSSFRIMAVAVSRGDRYGKAEASVRSSLPLQIRPVVPLAIRAGDRFDVPAVAANNTQAPAQLTASLEAQGFSLAPGQTSRPLRLDPGASERVTFAVEASRVGPGKLLFRLEGEGKRDSAEIATEAQSPASLEASAVYGKTRQAVEEQVASLGEIRSDVGTLEVTLSSSSVAGLGPGLEQLVEYPYGCTEQLTSRLVPLLSLRDVARGLGVALPANVDERSRETVEKILLNRDENGGFGLWRRSKPTAWVTTYALWGLSEAHRRGIPVDSEIFQGAEKYLGEVALGWPKSESNAARACFALDVLADLPGASDTARSHSLLVARQIAAATQGVPDFGRSLLLHAMARLGAGPDELAPLIKEVEKTLHLDGPLARSADRVEWFHDLLDSRARSSALALRGLQAAAPGHPMLEPLALGLVADRGPRGWRTTQETAWALLALDAFRRSQGSGAMQAKASLGGRELLSVAMKGPEEHQARLPLGELLAGGGALRFDAEGGELHYQARLKYAPVKLPTEPLFAGIEVNRRCRKVERNMEGEWDLDFAPSTSFEVGQWVQCVVEVITGSKRRFVSIEDPFAAGFEPVDPGVRNASSWAQRMNWGHFDGRELRPERALFFVDTLPPGTHHFSYLLRATTSGTFSAPPARAEEMYTPETYGRTGASTVTIAPQPR